MEWTTCEAKLSESNDRREMKRVAAEKHPTVVGVSNIVGVAVVGVEPTTIVIVFDIEHVEIVVGIRIYAKSHP